MIAWCFISVKTVYVAHPLCPWFHIWQMQDSVSLGFVKRFTFMPTFSEKISGSRYPLILVIRYSQDSPMAYTLPTNSLDPDLAIKWWGGIMLGLKWVFLFIWATIQSWWSNIYAWSKGRFLYTCQQYPSGAEIYSFWSSRRSNLGLNVILVFSLQKNRFGVEVYCCRFLRKSS